MGRKMSESKLTYEESRRQRLLENKKRMDELNLSKLAESLKSSSPKTSRAKKMSRPCQLIDPSSLTIRKSSRFADKPPPSYKEEPVEPLSFRRTYPRRDLLNRVYASDAVRKYAIERASQILSDLKPNYPCFVKTMLQSHVTGGFWLSFPLHFCKKHLPHHDEMMTLVDEDGNDFSAKYLTEKNGLSGGWRGFSIEHQLVDGDALVFQLVRPTEFKVYIIRAYETKVEEENDNGTDINPLEERGKRTRADDQGEKSENVNGSDIDPSKRRVQRARACNSYALSSNDLSTKKNIENAIIYLGSLPC